MSKRKVNVMDYASDIAAALPKGILLTTKAGSKVNSMVIGWGTIGINWSRPVMAVYVREHRFTREMLDRNPEFTINVPVGSFDKKIIAVCGSKSGRNLDKMQEAGLTLEEPELISVPGIREFPLTLECRVIYQQKQDLTVLGEDIRSKLYPADIDGLAVGCNRDPHITYFGEIVAAYVIEE